MSDLGAKVDAMIAAARRRLHKEIDRRAQYALGARSRETVNRSVGQTYRNRAGKAQEAAQRG